jgi:SSS family solute:Na+ symporter
MAQNFWTATYAFSTALILTFVITLFTKKLKTDDDLKGLVYSLTPRIKDDSKYWYQKPQVMAIVIGAIAIVLSIIFW